MAGRLRIDPAIEQRLTDDAGLVDRYRAEARVGGFAGKEGAFSCCALSGGHKRSRFSAGPSGPVRCSNAAAYANDVGLLAEEAGPSSGESLGTAQAFSHISLVNATCAIDQAERRNAA